MSIRGGQVGMLTVLIALLAPATARAAAPPPPLGCVSFTDDPESTQNYAPLQGSSDLNAQTGNDRLVAGLTREGTITVLRWPTPSSYDQVKHFSPDANLPRAGAAPNMGAFLGVVVDGRTTWLRDLPAEQRYRPGDSDTVVTVYRDAARGFTVTVESVVTAGSDVLLQHVDVRAGAAHRPSALVAFENFSLSVSTIPSVPFGDWCLDSQNTDAARWDAAAGAIVHARSGFDPSRGRTQSVALALGTRGTAAGHQVGGDADEPDAALAPADAYPDAADARLAGSGSWTGNTTGAVLTELRYAGDQATEDVFVTAAHDAAGALALLQRAREQAAGDAIAAKERHLAEVLAGAPMPAVRDPLQVALARRALILLATTQADSGAIVASITTQPVYAEDWPRDSAYLTEALDVAGLHDRARRHGLFLARTQATESRQPPGGLAVPPGAWPMNMFDTGASGGPIPYEFDEVGFGAWSMWRHVEHTHDRAYLDAVWPAIRRAAELLVSCRDAQTGLQCRNTEDDSIALFQQQTIGAAMTTYAGLGAAERAARELGHTADAARYAARRAELLRAVETHLWDDAAGAYGGSDALLVRKLSTYVFWPEVPALDPARLERHAGTVWRLFAPSFDAPGGDRTFGFYDGLALLGLGVWDRDHGRTRHADLQRGLRWIAHVQATPGTGHLGENWRVRDGRVETITARPQLWEHALFYLASLAVYGERRPPAPCRPRAAITVRAPGRILRATLHDARGRRLRTLRPAGRRVRVTFSGAPGRRVVLRLRVAGRRGVLVRRLSACR